MKTLALLSLMLLAAVGANAQLGTPCPCGTRLVWQVSWTCYQYANFFCVQDFTCDEIGPEDPDWTPTMCPYQEAINVLPGRWPNHSQLRWPFDLEIEANPYEAPWRERLVA